VRGQPRVTNLLYLISIVSQRSTSHRFISMISISSHNIDDPKETQQTQSATRHLLQISSGLNSRRSPHKPPNLQRNAISSHVSHFPWAVPNLAPFSTDHSSARSASPNTSGSDHHNGNWRCCRNAPHDSITNKSRKSNSLLCEG
jgi:hypothetical protein